ncbi:ribosomal protein S18-alanine N-acetyltransferase [Candidatus Bathyarchaeota archaeon]|nr:ribosomal protein S18-alanine N-acetyltransferase [Candidatus Bathyarchaeota archaeon]MBS7630463.1 ribosomal protein S18-alanine N-acetyltransferase [Candidatus Bathyarchaeota archaeon]
MSIHIRTFTAKDIEPVLSIEKESFDDAWPRHFFIYMHQKAPDLFLVAVQGEMIFGFVIGEIREIMFSGISHKFKVGHVLNIAVKKTTRRMGIGTQLMEEIEEKFKKSGASKVTLEVRESDLSAIHFYLNRGYQEIGRVKAYYPGEDALIMSKTL